MLGFLQPKDVLNFVAVSLHVSVLYMQLLALYEIPLQLPDGQPPRADAMGLTPYGVRILEAVMVPPVVYGCLVLMQSVSAFSNKRDLDCVECFCGQKAITSGMR